MSNPYLPSIPVPPIEKIVFENRHGVKQLLWVKRDDLIDPVISGNKWRKLKYNVKHAIEHEYAGIASFGGAFSNHIAALSEIGKRYGISTIGFIRTHQIDVNNPTLKLAKANGMTLIAMSREDYRQRHDPEFIKNLKQLYANHFFVPEGGSNQLSSFGLNELAKELPRQHFDFISTAVGSGGTIQGLLEAMPEQNFIGVPVVKDTELITKLTTKYHQQLSLDSHSFFGGYGKFTPELEQFCLEFYRQTRLIIEPIYTGKLFYALCHHQHRLNITPDSKVLAVHTGGLQGIAGLIYRKQLNNDEWRQLVQQ